MQTNSNSSENTVDFINEKNAVVPTGKVLRNYIVYIIIAIIIIGLIVLVVIRKRLNKS